MALDRKIGLAERYATVPGSLTMPSWRSQRPTADVVTPQPRRQQAQCDLSLSHREGRDHDAGRQEIVSAGIQALNHASDAEISVKPLSPRKYQATIPAKNIIMPTIACIWRE